MYFGQYQVDYADNSMSCILRYWLGRKIINEYTLEVVGFGSVLISMLSLNYDVSIGANMNSGGSKYTWVLLSLISEP